MQSRIFKGTGKFFLAAALIKQRDEAPVAPPANVNREENERSRRERLKELLLFRDQDGKSVNGHFIEYMVKLGFTSGVLVGVCQAYVNAVGKFIRTNDATMFASKSFAQRELVRSTMQPILLQGLMTGTKYSILMAAFVFTSTKIAVYRGEDGIFEYFIGGGVTNALRKCNLGIRGMLSGFFFGSMAGGAFGLLFWSILKLFGKTATDLKFSLCSTNPNYNEVEQRYKHFLQQDSMDQIYELDRGNLPVGLT